MKYKIVIPYITQSSNKNAYQQNKSIIVTCSSILIFIVLIGNTAQYEGHSVFLSIRFLSKKYNTDLRRMYYISSNKSSG